MRVALNKSGIVLASTISNKGNELVTKDSFIFFSSALDKGLDKRCYAALGFSLLTVVWISC